MWFKIHSLCHFTFWNSLYLHQDFLRFHALNALFEISKSNDILQKSFNIAETNANNVCTTETGNILTISLAIRTGLFSS